MPVGLYTDGLDGIGAEGVPYIKLNFPAKIAGKFSAIAHPEVERGVVRTIDRSCDTRGLHQRTILAGTLIIVFGYFADRWLSYVEGTREEIVQVRDLEISNDECVDLRVITDVETFEVSDELIGSYGDEDPLFMFDLGEKYRVLAQGKSDHSFFLDLHPTITAVHAISERGDSEISRWEHLHF